MDELSNNVSNIANLGANVKLAADSFDGSSPVNGVRSRVAIRDAARKLLLATSTPDDFCWNQILNMTQMIAIRICMKLGVFVAIPETGSISLKDLAAAVQGTPSLVERSYRILVDIGFLDHTQNGGEYCHTKFSLAWRNVEAPGPGTFFQGIFELGQSCGSLYSKAGTTQDSWTALANHPDITKTFAMSLQAVDALVPPTGFFDFNQFKASGSDDNRVQLVDVGGGYGKVLTDILAVSPEPDPSRCVLEDIQQVLAIANAARDKGVQMKVIDFHKEQPVKGARACYLRYIAHDYGDKDAINILHHVAETMAPDSKLLIADSVIPDRLVEATLLAGIMDGLMFCIGGRERTEAGFRAILEPNNLELVKIHFAPDTRGAIVEARLKPR